MNYNRPLKSDPHGTFSQPGACDQPCELEKKTEHGTEHSVSLPTGRFRGGSEASCTAASPPRCRTPPNGAVTAKSLTKCLSVQHLPPPHLTAGGLTETTTLTAAPRFLDRAWRSGSDPPAHLHIDITLFTASKGQK